MNKKLERAESVVQAWRELLREDVLRTYGKRDELGERVVRA